MSSQKIEQDTILKVTIRRTGDYRIDIKPSKGYFSTDQITPDVKKMGISLRVASAGPEKGTSSEKIYGRRSIWLNYNNEGIVNN